MKVPKYNKCDFDKSKEVLKNIREYYQVAFVRNHSNINRAFLSDTIATLDCAIAALDYCSKECVLIEVTERHTFANPDDVSDLDFPGVSSEDK